MRTAQYMYHISSVYRKTAIILHFSKLSLALLKQQTKCFNSDPIGPAKLSPIHSLQHTIQAAQETFFTQRGRSQNPCSLPALPSPYQ